MRFSDPLKVYRYLRQCDETSKNDVEIIVGICVRFGKNYKKKLIWKLVLWRKVKVTKLLSQFLCHVRVDCIKKQICKKAVKTMNNN